MQQTKKNSYALVAGAVIVGAVFAFTMYQFYRQSRIITGRLIGEHIKKMVEVFQQIDATAAISDIVHDKSYIDFLNVRSFSGSEVGSLNLVHPEKWSGPYVQENFTIEGKLYEIVKTKFGYYIVPGEGVRLDDGKTIGKEINFNQKTDMDRLVSSEPALSYDGKPLVARLSFKPRQGFSHALKNVDLFDEEGS